MTATKQFTTREFFQLSASKVTVSTVAPTPQSFLQFAHASCVIAWSVHAATDTLRKQLVPTTRYTMMELRQGLIDTLLLRPMNFLRTTMIEVVLIDHINDSVTDAEDMAQFVRGIVDAVPGCKLLVNLIPYNDINSGNHNIISTKAQIYRKPSMERILQYQKQLWSYGVYTHIRETRGDDDSAACGQLVTSQRSNK
jgi:23S rRNA (adenine2503-C2)-methyltransferase